jgi:hypothetical protein
MLKSGKYLRERLFTGLSLCNLCNLFNLVTTLTFLTLLTHSQGQLLKQFLGLKTPLPLLHPLSSLALVVESELGYF